MSDYDSDREDDIENRMDNMMRDRVKHLDEMRKIKRDEAKRRAKQGRETQDSEEARDRQRRFDYQMGKATDMGPSALLRNNEPERDAGYQPPSMIEFILGRNRRQRRQDEGPDDNKRPDDETPDGNPQTDGLIVNNLKF